MLGLARAHSRDEEETGMIDIFGIDHGFEEAIRLDIVMGSR